jgi:hypothetical protein
MNLGVSYKMNFLAETLEIGVSRSLVHGISERAKNIYTVEPKRKMLHWKNELSLLHNQPSYGSEMKSPT